MFMYILLKLYNDCKANVNIALEVAILRIVTRKKHPKIKLQHLRKIRIWTFGSLVHQINFFGGL